MRNSHLQNFGLVPKGLVIATVLSVSACSQDDRAASLSEEGRACLRAADAMIEIAQQAVNDPNSRPQRRESRRVLMEGWVRIPGDTF